MKYELPKCERRVKQNKYENKISSYKRANVIMIESNIILSFCFAF